MPDRDFTARQRIAATSIDTLELLYSDSRNPVHVACAYLEARANQLPIPNWVLAYLDDAFGNLHAAIDWEASNRPDVAAVVPEAFGFRRGGVAAAVNRRLSGKKLHQRGNINPLVAPFDNRNVSIGLEVLNELPQAGDKVTLAAEIVAQRLGVKRSTAIAAYNKHFKIYKK